MLTKMMLFFFLDLTLICFSHGRQLCRGKRSPLCLHDRDAALLSQLLKMLWPISKQPAEIKKCESFIDLFTHVFINSFFIIVSFGFREVSLPQHIIICECSTINNGTFSLRRNVKAYLTNWKLSLMIQRCIIT